MLRKTYTIAVETADDANYIQQILSGKRIRSMQYSGNLLGKDVIFVKFKSFSRTNKRILESADNSGIRYIEF